MSKQCNGIPFRMDAVLGVYGKLLDETETSLYDKFGDRIPAAIFPEYGIELTYAEFDAIEPIITAACEIKFDLKGYTVKVGMGSMVCFLKMENAVYICFDGDAKERLFRRMMITKLIDTLMVLDSSHQEDKRK